MIRAAVPADAAAVGRLKVRSWRAAYAGFLDPAYLDALDPVREAADWSGYLAAMPASHRLWVVEEAGAVVGFCRTGPADDDPGLGERAGEVYGLYVDPARTGTGLGRRLFAHAVADLGGRGLGPVCVSASRPNDRAIRFYLRAGFVADGTTRLAADGPGMPEVRLTAGTASPL